jgi:hypothetical protein
MSRKTKQANSVATVDEDGFTVLGPDHLWKWRALQAEVEKEQLRLEGIHRDLQAALSKQPEIVSLFEQKTQGFAAVSAAKAELLNVQAEIEALLGISLKEHALDDRTGRLHHVAPDGSMGQPVKRRRQRKPGS